MGVKKIPSLGAVTPIESLLKGGSAKDIFSPKNWWGDTMEVIRKPSLVLNKDGLTGQGDQSHKTLTSAAKEDEKNAAQGAARDFKSAYGDATTFRQRKDAGLKV